MFRTSSARSLVVLGVAALLASAQSALGAFMTVGGVTGNDASNMSAGEAQISIDVEDGGTDAVTGDTLVNFTFTADGDLEMAITQIYFDGDLFASIVSIVPNTGGVSFLLNFGPPVLPGGHAAGFVATNGLRAGAAPPVRPNGVDPGESLTITVSLRDGFLFADAINALTDGSMRIGMHVQGFDGGGSESFISNPLPSPGAATALALAGLACARRRRR